MIKAHKLRIFTIASMTLGHTIYLTEHCNICHVIKVDSFGEFIRIWNGMKKKWHTQIIWGQKRILNWKAEGQRVTETKIRLRLLWGKKYIWKIPAERNAWDFMRNLLLWPRFQNELLSYLAWNRLERWVIGHDTVRAPK